MLHFTAHGFCFHVASPSANSIEFRQHRIPFKAAQAFLVYLDCRFTFGTRLKFSIIWTDSTRDPSPLHIALIPLLFFPFLIGQGDIRRPPKSSSRILHFHRLHIPGQHIQSDARIRLSEAFFTLRHKIRSSFSPCVFRSDIIPERKLSKLPLTHDWWIRLMDMEDGNALGIGHLCTLLMNQVPGSDSVLGLHCVKLDRKWCWKQTASPLLSLLRDKLAADARPNLIATAQQSPLISQLETLIELISEVILNLSGIWVSDHHYQLSPSFQFLRACSAASSQINPIRKFVAAWY